MCVVKSVRNRSDQRRRLANGSAPSSSMNINAFASIKRGLSGVKGNYLLSRLLLFSMPHFVDAIVMKGPGPMGPDSK